MFYGLKPEINAFIHSFIYSLVKFVCPRHESRSTVSLNSYRISLNINPWEQNSGSRDSLDGATAGRHKIMPSLLIALHQQQRRPNWVTPKQSQVNWLANNKKNR